MRVYAPLENLEKAEKNDINQWVGGLISLLVQRSGDTVQFASNVDYRSLENWDIEVSITVHGREIEYRFSREFFASNEYQRLAKMGQLFDAGATVEIVDGDKTASFESLRLAFDWLLQDSRRSVNVQRYKGLGEMNPDQLCDTTMKVETRNLMQVQIEDAVAADGIFSTLMGDQVEPRRHFIEQNALSVTNLDT